MKRILIFLLISCLMFQSTFAEENEAAGIVKMDHQFLDGDILKISVITEDLTTPVSGIAFHLNFDKELLSFLRYEPGVFLEKGGDPFYLVNRREDKIIFGETLRKDDLFPVGGDLVVNLYFQILQDGEMKFSFERGVISITDIVRQDLTLVEWQDLTIQGNTQKSAVEYLKTWSLGISDQPYSYRSTLFAVLSFLTFFVFFLIARHMKRT